MTTGDPVTVNGRPGRIATVDVEDGCRSMGGDEQLRVVVPSDAIWNWDEIDACLRGPDHAAAEASIRSMLSNAPAGSPDTAMPSDATIPNDQGYVEAPGRLRLRTMTLTYPMSWGATRQPYGQGDRVAIATIGPPPVPSCANWASCGIWPATHLPANGILVGVWSSNNGDSTLATVPGTSLTMAGRPAKLAVGPADGACKAIGGDESMTANVQLEDGDSLTELDACLRGPDLTANEATFRAMLTSATPTPIYRP
jgi:hypothetical protein